MKVSELIAKLTEAQEKYGDLEVVIADGIDYNFYQGNFIVAEFEGTIDIGVGNCHLEQ